MSNKTEFLKILEHLCQYIEIAKIEKLKTEEVDKSLIDGLSKIDMSNKIKSNNIPLHNDCLGDLAVEIARCKACKLAESRTNTVPGEGNKNAQIMFIGEAPGADEDTQGRPFVGRAGKLLTKLIDRMLLSRDKVFIANILKCRPPNNRRPEPDEVAKCIHFLEKQISEIKPKVIVALGSTAVQSLLGIEDKISKIRGSWLKYNGIDLMPTFHPSYLLRNKQARWDVWSDMKKVLQRCNLNVPD